MNEPDEDEDMPQFHCHLPIPDGIAEGSRMLLQQIDILRQEIAWVYKRGGAGRRALVIAKKNDMEIAKLQRLVWMVQGAQWVFTAGVIAIELYLKFR